MVVMSEGDPVSFVPEDYKVYTQATSTFGTGTPVAPNTFILYGQSNGGAPNVKGLTPGRTYHATVFDMNGQLGPVYKIPGYSISFTLPNEPTAAPQNPKFVTVDGDNIRFDWTNGDGAKRIVVMRKGTAVTSLPQDGTGYTASPVFGTPAAEMTPGSGEYVVYNDSYNSVSITGLEKATTYHFAVFEYNLDGGSPNYLTAEGKWMAVSQATVSAPAAQTSALGAYNIQADQASITFTQGSGSSRVFVMREGSPVNAEPIDFARYSNNNAVFGLASAHLGDGNYVVGVGFKTNFIVSGLKSGTTYYLTAFEFNGNTGTVYLRPGAVMYSFVTTGGVVISAPTEKSKDPQMTKVDGNQMTIQWTKGNGEKRLVVARKTNAVTFTPADGTDYPANAAMGTSPDLGQGQFVVYNGSGNSFTLTAAEPNSLYHFAVFEYNGTGAASRYGDAFQTSQATALIPTAPSTEPSYASGQGSVTLSWIKGSGAGRLIVAKEGSAVTSVPQTLTKYSASSVFRNGPQLAAGEYVVYDGTGNTATITGLDVNKTYHFSIFEYNGTEAPVYNTTDVLRTTALITSTLPVKWLSVTATQQAGGVQVQWTVQESGVAQYVVEKSSDGRNFSVLTTMPAKNEEGTIAYTFLDAGSRDTRAYYRVRQVDSDGRFAYSNVVWVRHDKAADLVLLQNPVRQQLRFRAADYLQGAAFVVTDAGGRSVAGGRIHQNLTTVDLDGKPAGIYLLVITKGQTPTSIRFLKQ